MALEDGTYIIVPAVASSMAVSVTGGSNANGANIRLERRSGGDSQLVHVRVYGTYQMLIWSLTGKAAAISGSGVSEGSNVVQWDANNEKDERWAIVADGKTLTVSGTSYPTYKIRSVENGSYYMNVSNGGTASGTNINMGTYSAAVADWQRFAFVPVNILPDGIYEIRSAMDQTVCVGVKNYSNANGSRFVLDSENESRGDRFIFHVHNDALDTTKITNVMNGKAVTVVEPNPYNGQPVIQWQANESGYRWMIVPSGTLNRNGNIVPAYVLRTKAGTNFCMDADNGSGRIGTVLMLWRYSGGRSQRWEMRPTEMFGKTLSVPSDGKVAYSVGGDAKLHIWTDAAIDTYPTWKCNGTRYQLRYRVRYRRVNGADDSFTSWSSWRSILDGSTSNGGWGEIRAANCDATIAGGRCYSPTKVRITGVDNSTNDCCEVQYQVRKWVEDYAEYDGPAHGNSLTYTYRVIWRPALTVSDTVTWTPEGLKVVYTSDQMRNNNDALIYAVSGSRSGVIYSDSQGLAFSDIPHTGTLTIPNSKLRKIPQEGEAITLVMRFANVDGAYSGPASGTLFTATLSYDAGHGMTINPSCRKTEANTLLVTVSGSYDEKHLWMDYGDGVFERHDSTTGVWEIPYRLGRAFTVYVLCSRGANWDVWHQSFEAMDSQLVIWNWDSGFAVLKYASGSVPTTEVATTADVDSQMTNGDEFAVSTFGPSFSGELTISGLIPPQYVGLDGCTQDAFDELLKAHHAWYRTPLGHLYRVGIRSVRVGEKPVGSMAVSVSMVRENAPVVIDDA